MNLRVTYGNTVTVAEIEMDLIGANWVFIGEAKMHPNDSYNQDIGEAYAVSRAMKRASVILEIIADGKVSDAWLAKNSIL